jgi:biotin carboxylase
MVKMYCLDDRGGWGQELQKEALSRGWSSHLFTSADYEFVENGIAFMRLAQESDRLALEKPVMSELHKRGVYLIPKWMPETHVINDRITAESVIDKMPFPFISKSRTGSASRNIRIIRSSHEARVEVEAAFGDGISAPHKMGEINQRGYLIWQEFLQGNQYDYRIVATGKQIMVLQRWNRKDTPFASGSGINNPAEWSAEVQEVIEVSKKFLAEEKILWAGLDLVQNKDTKEWKILEITLGWSAAAYAKCQYYGTPYFGKDIWKVLCNEIEKGVFNV